MDFENREPKQFSWPEIIDGNTIKPENIVLPREIIAGMFSLSEKLELSGGSKSFKTWSLIDLGLSVASESCWWGNETSKTHVVYLNMELHQPFFEQRLVEVAQARRLLIPSTFHVVHLRGLKLHMPGRWEGFITYLEGLLYRFPEPLLISDPIYKLLGGRNENAAGDINAMMEQLEDLVQRTRGSNAFGHHHTKGNQADKDSIDRASGSGVFQRDPDCLLDMTKHETDNCYTLSTVLRNHPPLNNFVLEWHYPLFVRRPDLDPTDLKKPPGAASKYSVAQLVDCLGHRCLKTIDFQKRARNEIGMTPSTFYVLLKKGQKEQRFSKSVTTEEWEVVKA